MGKVIVDIAMSLDGFIAGTNVSPQLPMGDNGLRLHDWIFDKKTDIDANMIKEVMETSGVVIVGRHTYDVAIDDAWGGESPFPMPHWWFLIIKLKRSLTDSLLLPAESKKLLNKQRQ